MSAKADRSLPSSSTDRPDVLLRPSSSKIRRLVRRPQLRLIVPLSDTTIWELEKLGQFPRRFNLTPRCVVWDLAEVEAWVEARKASFEAGKTPPTPKPDVHQRKRRPVRQRSASR